MEAIAHWMQCRSVGTGKSSRAVVPYSDLHSFLTEFISKSERPAESEPEARDSATEFLDFVKKRAGLLIEAGDEQYSFVHLTFQEYLTATHIITANEVAGAVGIWAAISSYARDARWHEVIRLLMGGLKSPASQSTLLKNLLAANHTGDQNVSELVGGFVLDGIEPAEERLNEILDQVLTAAARCETIDDCRRLVRMVKAWGRKDNFNEASLNAAFTRLLEKNANLPLASLLVAPACGLEYQALQLPRKRLAMRQDENFTYSCFSVLTATRLWRRISKRHLIACST